MKNRLLAALGLMAVIMIVPTAAIATLRTEPGEVISSLNDDEARRIDVLPEHVVTGLGQSELVAQRARLLQADGDVKHYVAPSRGGLLCVVTELTSSDGPVFAAGCNSPEAVQSMGEPLVLRVGNRVSVAILVPDGYDDARTDEGGLDSITNNIVAFQGDVSDIPSLVTLESDTKEDIAVPIPLDVGDDQPAMPGTE